VFQSYAIWPHAVFANVAIIKVQQHGSPPARSRRSQGALRLVGMEDFAGRQATQTVRRQQQRRLYPRFSAGRLLLLDEPLSSSQIAGADALRIAELISRTGVTTLRHTLIQALACPTASR
jgi:ABC-type Fe3+/spermidine/putrescine transport system ATPase subunit